jgi:hypothetical protein
MPTALYWLMPSLVFLSFMAWQTNPLTVWWFSRFSVIYGLTDKSTNSVVEAIKEYSASVWMSDTYGFIDIDRFHADAGPEFTFERFKQFCVKNRISLSLLAPKRQDNNHLAERSWQTIHRMARSMLVHARLPDKNHFHAIRYTASVFNVLPVKNLYNSAREIRSPFELFCGKKPTIAHLRVFGCPVVAKRAVISIYGLRTTHCTEKGIRGDLHRFSFWLERIFDLSPRV